MVRVGRYCVERVWLLRANASCEMVVLIGRSGVTAMWEKAQCGTRRLNEL